MTPATGIALGAAMSNGHSTGAAAGVIYLIGIIICVVMLYKHHKTMKSMHKLDPKWDAEFEKFISEQAKHESDFVRYVRANSKDKS